MKLNPKGLGFFLIVELLDYRVACGDIPLSEKKCMNFGHRCHGLNGFSRIIFDEEYFHFFYKGKKQ
ncbi:hypothetical protein [Flavobacterium sp. A45]|uniref:hypothetical protein n=1 Tax=Flavobacterium sp. A45 TaxID=1945862 RepID=UPI0009872715|nr:hypothetical protein [Flavobacterium sp. A45]OOG75469.1 hypothetical protein B0E44_04715 [Flavobacterium sp. A45]